MIILFFGQPASGKTTLADGFLNDKSISEYFWNFVRIDGDKWRDITKNKDYSKEGRVRNLKGAFDMALYLEKDDYIPVLSFVTPYQELRDYLRENSNQLVEIYLEYNEDRGRNDRFAKDFENPDETVLKLNTSEKNIDECLIDIKHFFNQKQNR